MTRAYQNPDVSRRSNLSTVVLVLIGTYGLWELWRAGSSPADSQTIDYLFGIAFVGGAAYGLRQIISDTRDLVLAFDVEPTTGNTVATLWRPFGRQRLEADRDRLTDWRFYVRIGKRNVRTFCLYVTHPDYPRPLQLELRRGLTVSDDLRRLAPEAIGEFERATGASGG